MHRPLFTLCARLHTSTASHTSVTSTASSTSTASRTRTRLRTKATARPQFFTHMRRNRCKNTNNARCNLAIVSLIALVSRHIMQIIRCSVQKLHNTCDSSIKTVAFEIGCHFLNNFMAFTRKLVNQGLNMLLISRFSRLCCIRKRTLACLMQQVETNAPHAI